MPMGDDPFVNMPVIERGPRPEAPEISFGNDDECMQDDPICPPPEECSAVMQKEEGRTISKK